MVWKITFTLLGTNSWGKRARRGEERGEGGGKEGGEGKRKGKKDECV